MADSKKRDLSSLLLILVLFTSIFAVCAICASSSSILLTETVSRESDKDSLDPSFDISSQGVIHAVWVDSTDFSRLGFSSANSSLGRNNGPDKDIFFNYRENGAWSIPVLSGNQIIGGVEVLSNSSITSSIQPDIAFDSEKVSHVVWSSLIPPAELVPDGNTLFMMHFNSNSSIYDADYALGESAVTEVGSGVTSSSITSDALIGKSIELNGPFAELNFSAQGNYNGTQGTIELWFNLVDNVQRKNILEGSILFELVNRSNSSEYLVIIAGGSGNPSTLLLMNSMFFGSSYILFNATPEDSYLFPFNENEWHHLAFTYNISDPENSQLKSYIDGYLSYSETLNLSPMSSFYFDTICIGPCLATTSSAYARIDELMISDKVRSAAEIKAHAGNRSIFYMNITNNTVMSDQQKLTDGVNLSYAPKIFIDYLDRIHLVYNEVHNRTSVSVMYMMKNSTSWSQPELVSSSASVAYLPDVTADTSNKVHSVWEEFSTDNYNISYIHYKKKTIGGLWAGDENVSAPSYGPFASKSYPGRRILGSYFPKKPRIMVGADSKIKVAWADNINYPEDNLTFYASLNEGPDADYAAGSSSAVSSGGLNFVESFKGMDNNQPLIYNGINAVNFTSTDTNDSLSSHITYSAPSNLNLQKGAISMWVSPNFYPAYGNFSNFLFSSSDPNSLSNMMWVAFFGQGSIMVIFIDKDGNPFAVTTDTQQWRATEWRHIGLSWDLNTGSGRSIVMTMNGKQKYLVPLMPDNFNDPVDINVTYPEFIIGAAYNSTYGYTQQFNGSIDEIKIYNSTRTVEQFNKDMINSYDIFYRERNSTGWSDILLMSGSRGYSSLNPSITEANGNPLLVWSSAEGDCELDSDAFPNCAAFETISLANCTSPSPAHGDLILVNDESTFSYDSFNPQAKVFGDDIFYLWEDNSKLSGNDWDIDLRNYKTSSKPEVNITADVGGQIFFVPNQSIGLNISLSANASDADNTISNVTFFYTVDGANGEVACTAYSDPFSCIWNIRGIAEDYYKIKAISTSDDSATAWDQSNYSYYDTIYGIHNYLMNSSPYNKAYYTSYWNYSTEGGRQDLVTGISGTTPVTLDLLSGIDQQYVTVSGAPSCLGGNYINSLLAVFYINESISSIDSLEVFWRGRGYERVSYLTNLSIWNFNEQKWVSLAYKDFILPQDDNLRYTITQNVQDYIEPSNRSVYVLIETYDNAGYSCVFTPNLCPTYSAWNGTDYIFETEGLLGLLNKRMETATYDKMRSIKEEDGVVKIKVSEELPEVLFLNSAELISADHPAGTDVFIDPEGRIHSIDPKTMQNVVCTDSSGRDCSALVAHADEKPKAPGSSLEKGLVSSRSNTDKAPVGYTGNAWVTDINSIDLNRQTEDYLYLTLPDKKDSPGDKDNANLIISGSESGLMSFSEFTLFALGKDNLPIVYSAIDNTFFGDIMKGKIADSAKITVQILDEEGNWKDYPYPGSFDNAILGAYETIIFPLNMSLVRQDRIRLRMTALAYMIDFIGIDYSEDGKEDEKMHISYSEPDKEELKEQDDSRLIIKYKESAEISFKTPGQGLPEGYSRSYFLMTSGYYHPLESVVFDDKKDYNSGVLEITEAFSSTPLYLYMYADSDYAKRYLISKYLKNDLIKLILNPSGYLDSMKDDFSENLPINSTPKHNTLYTDLVKITVNTCTVPVNNMKITDDTTLCSGTFFRPDNDYNLGQDYIGIIQITGSNLTLDCNNSALVGGGDQEFGAQSAAGVAIGVNQSENVVIKNCNISGYKYGIGINESRNITVVNNSIYYVEAGIGGENTNESLVYNNDVQFASLSAYSFLRNSTNNRIENNTAENNFASFSLETSNNNTIRNNIITATGSGFSHLVGIVLFSGSNYNLIDNNQISDTIFGTGMADIARFLTGSTGGAAGNWNNFSRNTISDTAITSLGIMFPYPVDYFNYFEDSNTANGDPIYYFVNLHGNSSDYVQINGIDLSGGDTGFFLGKITLVNCSYINISSNYLRNNFFNLLLVNSSNISISNNYFYNATDTFDLYSSSIDFARGTPAGTNLMIISSIDISIFNNTMESGLFGITLFNSSKNINVTGNNLLNNTRFGIYMHSINSTRIIGNTIFNTTRFSDSYGIYSYYVQNSTIKDNNISFSNYGIVSNISGGSYIGNLIFNNSNAGILIYDAGNGLYFDGNRIENNSLHGVKIANSRNVTISNIQSNNNLLGSGMLISNSEMINVINLTVMMNWNGISFTNTNNSDIVGLYSANSTTYEVAFSSSMGNKILDSIIVNDIFPTAIQSSLSDNMMINTTFNKSSTGYDGVSNLSVGWHLDFYVQDNESYVMQESVPIEGVNITLNDVNGSPQIFFTNNLGYSYINASEYVENATSRRYFSNYTWNLTKPGYNFTENQIRPYVTSTNLTDNQFFNLSMVLTGGFQDTEPPTTATVVDGPDYIDVDWISNRTTLQASWYNSTDRFLIFYSYRILDDGVCVPNYCVETYAGQNTSVTVTGLNLTEGHNYSFAVRARDSFYWYSPFSYSDGAIADFTPPVVFVNSTTHPNQSEWYSGDNVTLNFYGADLLSGVAAFSYSFDDNSGTGPDLIAEPKPVEDVQSIINNGYHVTLKSNNSGKAFAAISKVKGNLTAGDNIIISVPLSEDTSDTIDRMSVTAYLVDISTQINGFDNTNSRISTISELSEDITHRPYSGADIYSFNLTALSAANDYYYVVIAGVKTDDDNEHNLSIAGSDSGFDNSTDLYVCSEDDSCVNLTLAADLAIGIQRQINSTRWTQRYYNTGPGQHWFHVRALDNAGNWGDPVHYLIQVDSVSGAPQFVNIQPVGYVASTNPTLSVETNEYATCYYNETNSSYVQMTSYDGIIHESELALPEGTYSFGFNCTDLSGNSAYNGTTFTVNSSVTPDSIVIWPMGNYTAGQLITAYANVTKTYNSIPYGLGGLSSRFYANLTNSSGSKYAIPIETSDRGGGLYTIKFTAPSAAGTYTLSLGVMDVKDTEDFMVNSYSLTILYTGATDSSVAESRIAYGILNNKYSIGLASNSEPILLTGSSSQLALKYYAVEGDGFIFITNPFSNPASRSKYLEKGTFTDLKNPSFGHDINEEQHVVSTILYYPDLHLIGNTLLHEGRYSLIIRNDGVNVSSGKTKITVSII